MVNISDAPVMTLDSLVACPLTWRAVASCSYALASTEADEQEVVDVIFKRLTSTASLWIPKIKKSESSLEIKEI